MWILIILEILMLGVCAVSDIQRREIDLYVILLITAGAIIYRGYTGEYWEGFWELGLRLLPGLLMVLVSIFKKNVLGMGDSIIVLASGYILGATLNTAMLLTGFVISGVYGLILVCFKKRKMNDTVPFVPFLLCGCILFPGLTWFM